MLPRHILRLSRHCVLLPKLIRPLGCHGIHGRLPLFSLAGTQERSKQHANDELPLNARDVLMLHRYAFWWSGAYARPCLLPAASGHVPCRPELLACCVAVVGNSTLDFNYYGPVEEYATYVKSRPACYIDEDNPGMIFSDAAMSVGNPCICRCPSASSQAVSSVQ
jgi:hypothetical protein